MKLSSACICIGLTFACSQAFAEPFLQSVRPRGAKVGSAVRLTLEGKRLGPSPRLHTDARISLTSLVATFADASASSTSLVYLAEIDAAAEPGIYALRMETSEGISNALLFTVTEFDQVVELESETDLEEEIPRNDFLESAQPIQAPVTVEGRLQGADRDIYRIEVEAGQRIVAEVAARRLGSAIDPNLELSDSDGRVIARNHDAQGLGLDARLSHRPDEAGTYYLSVRDERYSDQVHDFYRLTVGDFDFAGGVFPLGWKRGERVQAQFFGGNLEQSVVAEVDVDGGSGYASETWLRVPDTPSFMPFLVSDRDEVLESDANGGLEDGVVVNGRILQAEESDTYRLPVQPGEDWSFQLRSGELPGSSLYGVITIASGSEVLAVAGKHAGDPNPYVITTTGQTATFPFVNLTVPPDTTELVVTVEDLLDRGGSAFGYRLLARKEGPDFLLTLNTPYINIPSGGSVLVNVTAERRGYFGPIELYLEGAPGDIEFSGGHFAPTSTLGNTFPRFETSRLTLSATPDADHRMLELVVRGKATEPGMKHLDRRATGPGVRVSVKGETNTAVTAPWMGLNLPARINPAQGATLSFDEPRRLRLVRGANGLLSAWSYKAHDSSAKLKKPIDLPRNAGSLRIRSVGDSEDAEGGKFRMFTHERSSLGMANLNITATVTSGGRDEQIISKPLEIDVVDGYALSSPEEPLDIQAGSKTTWKGSLWRDPLFQRSINVSVVGLPLGVSCQSAELASPTTDYALECEATDKAPEGEHEVEIRAESVLSDEGTTPYIVDPAKAIVRIAR